MGHRYVTGRVAPVAEYDDWRPALEAKTVFESDPINTGLVDKSGQPIFRVKAPVGFIQVKDR